MISVGRRMLCLAIGAPTTAAGAYLAYLLFVAEVVNKFWTWAVFALLFGGAALLWSAATGK